MSTVGLFNKAEIKNLAGWNLRGGSAAVMPAPRSLTAAALRFDRLDAHQIPDLVDLGYPGGPVIDRLAELIGRVLEIFQGQARKKSTGLYRS